MIDLSVGLTSAEVAERIAAGEVNHAPDARSRSIGDIIRANTFTWFNGVIGIMWVIMIMVAPLQDSLFGFVIVANTLIGIIQEFRASRALAKLAVIGEAKPTVRRDGEAVMVSADEVVLDDIIVLSPGDQLVVDGTILASEGLEIDESLLTGEADPVDKTPGDPGMSGSFVVAGSGPLLPAVADGLKQRGAHIQFIAEQASFSRLMSFAIALLAYPNKLIQGMGVKCRLLGVPYRFGWWPVKAEGDARVERVTLTNGSHTRTLDCDALACGFNLIPNTELAMLLGCAIANDAVQVDDLQQTTIADVYSAGESTGIGGVDCALVEGGIAGLAAAGLDARARTLFAARNRWRRFRILLGESFALRPELRALAKSDTLVCRCEDVAFGPLERRAGWRDAKLQTRCGMGPCQGRVCGGAVQFLFGWKRDGVRPPLYPVSAASLAVDMSVIPPASTSTQEPL